MRIESDVAHAIGRHGEAIDTLKREVTRIGEDVTDMKAILEQAKGGWRTLVGVGSIAGAIGAALVKLFGAMKGGV